jgi:hypothetical protein
MFYGSVPSRVSSSYRRFRKAAAASVVSPAIMVTMAHRTAAAPGFAKVRENLATTRRLRVRR